MIELFLILLAALSAAVGYGAARENSTNDNETAWGWESFSRTRAKKALRARGFRLAAGELALLMGDHSWRPGQPRPERVFCSVPREGRPWQTSARRATRRQEREGKSSPRRQKGTRAAILAKLARDRAAREQRRQAKAARRPNRALPKGVWARRVNQKLAERRAQAQAFTASTPVRQGTWRRTVRRTRGNGALLSLARESSVSRYHAAADELAAARARLASATTAFERGQARAEAAWAATDLRKELLAA